MKRKNTDRFYDRALPLDELKTKSNLSQEEIEYVIKAIQDPSINRYFFDDLDNPAWLQPLFDGGIFSDSPGSVKSGETSWFYPKWPASEYLARVAAKDPRVALEVLRTIQTSNPWVFGDLTEAIVALPSDYAASAVNLVEGWLVSVVDNAAYGVDKAKNLLSKLSKDGYLEAALDLLRILISPEEKEIRDDEGYSAHQYEPKPRYEVYFFEQVLEVAAEALFPVAPVRSLSILRRGLESASLHNPFSTRWRKAVEDHRQNWRQDEYLSILLVAVRELTDQVVSVEPDYAESLLLSDTHHSLSIFRRLAIHFGRVEFNNLPNLVNRLFESRHFLDDSEVFHEYFVLLKERYSELSQEQQNNIVRWIKQGPESPYDADHPEWWTVRWLKGIPGSVSEEIDSDIPREARRDMDAFPGGVVWEITPSIRNSPINKDELWSLSDVEIIDYLQNYDDAGHKSFSEPTKQGLASLIERMAREHPDRFSKLSERFIEVDSLYITYLLSGIYTAWKEDGASVDWPSVFKLFNFLSDTQQDTSDEYIGEARRRMLDILHTALVNTDATLPSQCYDEMLDIVLPLFDSADTPWPKGNPIGAALNTVHGKAMETLLNYALYYARIEYPRDSNQSFPAENRLHPDIAEKLSDLLDEQYKPNMGVQAWYGAYLTQLMYLDRDWLTTHLDAIFPPEQDKLELWRAAWEGYIYFSSYVYPDIYELLFAQYARATDLMKGSSTESETIPKLGQHLIVLYLRGEQDINAPDSLISRFLEEASDSTRSHLVWFMQKELARNSDLSSETWAKLRNYWEARAKVFKEANEPSLYREEAQAFCRWLTHVPASISTLFDIVIETCQTIETWYAAQPVLDYLMQNVDKEPNLVAEVLELIASNTHSALIPNFFVQVDSLLAVLSQSDQEKVREVADKIINQLGEKGIYSFKKYLPEFSN